MGVLAPVSAHMGHIDTSKNFSGKVSGKNLITKEEKKKIPLAVAT